MKPPSLPKTSPLSTRSLLWRQGVFFREFTKAQRFFRRDRPWRSRMSTSSCSAPFCSWCSPSQASLLPFSRTSVSRAFVLHNIALPFMVIMLYVRGIDQVIGLGLPDAAIAGMAGLSHIAPGRLCRPFVSPCLIKASVSLEACLMRSIYFQAAPAGAAPFLRCGIKSSEKAE